VTAVETARRRLIQGAVNILIAEVLLAAMAAVIKHVSLELPNPMLVFFRNLFGLVVVAPIALRHGPRALRTQWPHLHLLRALAGVGAMYCFFYTISAIPLAEAVLLKLTAPFFIPLIALAWLGERLPLATLAGIAIGFGGVALVLQPGLDGIPLAGLTGLAGAALAGLAKVAIRAMGPCEPAPRIVFYFGSLATVASAVPLLWAWQTPGLTSLAWLGLMGLCATGAQLLLTRAYSLAPAGRIGPFSYVAVIYSSVLGWAFWSEVPGLLTLAGSLLITLAGVLTLYRPPETSRQTAQ
jgi:drug/metabolite transporter (DMT)-like permease